MLFTQATAVGIQLENALILSPENLAKSQITANNERIQSLKLQQTTSVFLTGQKTIMSSLSLTRIQNLISIV